MTNLLQQVIAAHGGSNWGRFDSAYAEITIAGTIWDANDGVAPFADAYIEMKTAKEFVSISPKIGFAGKSLFRPNILTLETAEGGMVETQYNPRSAFIPSGEEQAWDTFQIAYICSYSVWNILTQPFLFGYSGFEAAELPSLELKGEIVRRLKVTFPPSVAAHSRQLICFVGADGLIRRQDMSFDLLGGIDVTSFPSDYEDIQGIMVPLQRRMYKTVDIAEEMGDPVLASFQIRNLEFA